MKVPRGYSRLFKTGQYGRFYFVSGTKDRGKTFRIQILPEGVKAIPNGSVNLCVNDEAIEVYGIVDGNPKWIHRGPWIRDFQKLVDDRIATLEKEYAKIDDAMEEYTRQRAARVKRLVEEYSKDWTPQKDGEIEIRETASYF